MEAPKILTSQLPDKALYHYSAPSGMLGMIERKSIWMSNIRYQNDSEEYLHIFKIFEDVLKEYEGPYLGRFAGYNETKPRFVPPIFTFSLTEKEDLLSQWRGYCPRGGYSFSFDKTQLETFVRKFDLTVQQCEYKENEQKRIIREQVIKFTPQEWSERLANKTVMDPAFSHGLKYMYNRLVNLSPVLKHHSFEEEAEWRLIKDFDRGGPEVRPLEQHPAFDFIRTQAEPEVKRAEHFLRFREGKGTLIPYLSLPLVEDIKDPYQGVKLADVIIGPGAQQEIAIPACQSLLKSWGVRCSVRESVVPYRE